MTCWIFLIAELGEEENIKPGFKLLAIIEKLKARLQLFGNLREAYHSFMIPAVEGPQGLLHSFYLIHTCQELCI